MSLTTGALEQIIQRGGKVDQPPTLQILHLKKISAANGSERIRIVLSDGATFLQGMLASQTSTDELLPNCVIRMDDYMINKVNDKQIIILLSFQLVQKVVPDRIGNPVEYTAKGPTAAPVSSTAPLYNSTNNTTKPPVQKPSPNNRYRPSTTASAAPIVRTNVAAGTTPIAALNMYSNRWTLQARLTHKSDVRTWRNSKGEGCLFSIELLDTSGDIRGTFFKEAVDKYYNLLQVGQVYRVTGGRIKVANMQYNTCKSAYEITFDMNTEIHQVQDDQSIQAQSYEFTSIADIEQKPENSKVDVLGVAVNVSDPVQLISKKTGNELTKSDVTLLDASQTQITVTLWGDAAKNAPTQFANTPVVAFRRARVSDYSGKSLSNGAGFDIAPQIPEAQTLAQWFTAHGAGAARSLSTATGGGRTDSFADRKSIGSIAQEHLGNGDKPDWISFKGTVAFLKKDKEGGAWYPACADAGEPCQNRYKMTQTTDGQWYCDKCEKTFPNPVRRWIFSGVLDDPSASTWVTFFNEQAESMLGETADEVHAKAYPDGTMGAFDSDAYDSVFTKALGSEWIFKCKVKSEIHNDESRVKASVYAMQPVDYVKESQDLLQAIAQF